MTKIVLPRPNEKIKAILKNPRIILAYSEPKVGKALTNDSLILTDKGMKYLSDLSMSDVVAGSDGEFYSLQGIFPQGRKNCFRVTFSDYSSVDCCEDHLWKVINKKQRRGRVVEIKSAKSLYKDFYINKRYSYAIDFVKPINFSLQSVEIHPYMLGMLIADGCLKKSKRLCLSHIKYKLVPYLEEVGNTKLIPISGNNWDYNIESKDLIQKIINIGLNVNSYEKFIPDNYLINSIENRILLLQGLLDGDGSADAKTGIEYSTTSKKLCNNVCDLVRGLGGKATVYYTQGSYGDEFGERIWCKDVYRIRIQFFNSYIVPFQLQHKLTDYNYINKFKEKSIISVKEIGEKDCTCISTTAPDKLFVTDGYNITHNTSLFATLPDSLLIDVENGSDYVDAVKVQVNSLEELTEVGRQLIKDNFPFKYGILDTATQMEAWCEDDATLQYKESVIGKNFKGDSVTAELPKGAGYYWLRKSYGTYFSCLASWFPTLIVLAHVRDKMLVDKKGNQVEAVDLDLTGKLRQITCAKADAICYLHRKTVDVKDGRPVQEIFASFRSEGITTGSRSRHLEGKDISISKVVGEDEEIKVDWNKIFLKEEK